jgi:hypothetical protein
MAELDVIGNGLGKLAQKIATMRNCEIQEGSTEYSLTGQRKYWPCFR